MKADRWEKIESAWYHARNLRSEDRSRFLDDVCGSDAAMRQQIETLLQQDEDPNIFLNRPAVELLAGSLTVFTGTRVGAYEILEPIGTGGMGEVYRARDTKLHRDVALKFLPAHLAADPDRLSRFRREAQILAALNRPDIAQIYGLEESNGTYCIAMEFVEGETLADRVRRGPIPTDEALRIARDIAEALEAAYEKGIVHRDLKPANVKVTPEGQVKVLDFGLAKTQASASTRNLSDAPTLSIEATNTGMIMGTAPYMSPEQAKGTATDHRTDVFSFGCVLYEMLTGRRTFQGETVSDVIASVLARDPDLSSLPAEVPKVRDLIRRCLEKDVRRRWQAIGDVRVEIEAIEEDPRGLKALQANTQQLRGSKHFIAIVIVALIASLITAVVVWNLRRLPPEIITQLSFSLPQDMHFTRPGRHVIAISPDGLRIAFVANSHLNLRNMADREIQPLAGTDEDPTEPFFSPDGRWIAFWSYQGKLKKIAVTGGPLDVICDSSNPFGASWNSDDQILIGQGQQGILRVAATGGKPETIISVNSGESAQGPQMLPDGETILFTLAKVVGLRPQTNWDQAQIVVQSLKSGVRKVLINGGSDARYVPTGHIVYVHGSTLLAAPFDVKSLRVGDPIPVVEDVWGSAGTMNGQFSFSRNGAMIYVPAASGFDTDRRSLALIDLSGTVTRLDVPPGAYAAPRFSPDSKQIAWHTEDGVIWIYDVAGISPMRKLNLEKGIYFPVWTRDGHIVFNSFVGSAPGLSWQPADSSALAEQLVKPEGFKNPIPMWVTSDGKIIFEDDRRDESINRVYASSLNGDQTPKLLFQVKGGNPSGVSLSPDGRWLAYDWIRSPNDVNIYVEPFPPTGIRHQVTADGGWQPMWSQDGKLLLYVRGVQLKGQTFWSVDIRTEPSFGFGKPKPLFTLEGATIVPVGKSVDFSPVSNKFVAVLAPPGNDLPLEVRVVLNWFTDLKQKVPLK